MRNQILVSGISTVIAGKKVTIDLDTGWKYLKVHIKRTNITAAQALNYRLKINGKIRQELPAFTDIENLNTHYGRPNISGVTTIYFNRPELADSEDRDLSGLGTADIKSVQIEFEVDAACVSPDIEVKADVTTNENIGWITKLEASDIALTKVGANVVSKMPVGDGNVFCYFLKKPTNDMTDVQLIRVVNGAKTFIIDSSKEFLEVDQKQAPMVPRAPVTATQTALDFTVSGVPEDALQTEYVQIPGQPDLTPVERISAVLTVGTAETVTCITESVGQFTDA